MELGLKGKNVLITGGSRGIGKATALAFAKEGCRVAICARDQTTISSTLDELYRYDSHAIGMTCDVLNKEDIQRVVDSLTRQWGGVHVLVNNVGGGGTWGKYDILETPEKVWTEVYEKNVFAAVRFTLGFLPWMLEQKWGRVVTVSSISGLQAHERPWFGIAKHAEFYLMKSLARRKEYARSGITFNTVAPGKLEIPGTGWAKQREEDPEQFARCVEDPLPMGRLGSPEEIADLLTFICSTKAGYLNGGCITVDGGESVVIC